MPKAKITPGPHSLVLPCLLLVVLCLIAYCTTLRNKYIWDDDAYLTNTPTLSQQPSQLRQVWTNPSARPQYYPMVFTSFLLEDYLWHRDPAGYHFTNILLQAANACLLYLLLRRLKIPGWQRGAAWLAAALFAVHPMQVETVAWITERKNLLSTLFFFASFLAYLRFSPLDLSPLDQNLAANSNPPVNHPPANRHWPWYLLALFFFILGLLSKSVIAVWPGVWLVLLWWKHAKITFRDLVPLLPFALLGLLAGLNTAYLEVHQVGAQGSDWSLTPPERILVAGRAFWFYLIHWLAPFPLSFNYPRWTLNPALWWQWIFPLSAVALFVILWATRKVLTRAPLAAALLFAGILFPVLGFMNVYPFRYSFVADHFQYLASAVPAAAAGSLLTLLLTRWPRPASLAIITLLALFVLDSANYARVFQNQKTLWTDVLQKNNTSFAALNILGQIARDENNLPQAIAYHRRAVQLRPASGLTRANLGVTLLAAGNNHDALSTCLQACQLSPEEAAVWNALGNVYLKLNQIRPAAAAFERALTLHGDHYGPLFNLGLCCDALGNFPKAEEYFRRALDVRPDQPDTLANLARVQIMQNKTRDALIPLQRAAELDPKNPETLSLFAGVLASLPDATSEQATTAWQLATQANVLTNWKNPDYLNTLSITQLRLGMWAQAVQTMQKELSLLPDPAARAALQSRIALIQAALAGKKPAAPPK